MRNRTMLISLLGGLAVGLWATPSIAQDVLSMDAERMIAERHLQPVVHQAVRFLSLVQTDQIEEASRLFQLSQPIRERLQAETINGPLSRVDFEPPFQIELIGFQPLGRQVVELLYVATTESGPVSVRIRIYQHDRQVRLAALDVTDEWDTIDAMLSKVTRLPTSLVISASPRASGSPELSGMGGPSVPVERSQTLGSESESSETDEQFSDPSESPPAPGGSE